MNNILDKTWVWNEFDWDEETNKDRSYLCVMTGREILKQKVTDAVGETITYWEYWVAKMKKVVDSPNCSATLQDITEEICVDEFVVCNWAWERKD